MSARIPLNGKSGFVPVTGRTWDKDLPRKPARRDGVAPASNQLVSLFQAWADLLDHHGGAFRTELCALRETASRGPAIQKARDVGVTGTGRPTPGKSGFVPVTGRTWDKDLPRKPARRDGVAPASNQLVSLFQAWADLLDHHGGAFRTELCALRETASRGLRISSGCMRKTTATNRVAVSSLVQDDAAMQAGRCRLN